MTRPVVTLGGALALGFGAGVLFWGILAEGAGIGPILRTAAGVSAGVFVGFPVWVQVGLRFRSVADRRFGTAGIATVLGVTFGAVMSLSAAIVTGRLESDLLTALTGFRLPIVLGLWNSLLLGLFYGLRSSKSRRAA